MKITMRNEIVVSDDMIERFLKNIGYLDFRKPSELAVNIAKTLIHNPDSYFPVERLSRIHKTSRPTIYRHISKLYKLGMVEKDNRRGYRLKCGRVDSAFKFYVLQANVLLEEIGKLAQELSNALDTGTLQRSHIIQEVEHADSNENREQRKQDNIQPRPLREMAVG
jgi:DNA-binding transcriptional ArsR family regulator